jgi:hypothetical protein
MSNIVAVLIVRCTHTGVYADGRPNPASVTLYDLDEITIQKNRTRAVPVPFGAGTTLPPVDIPMSTRTFVSWHQGDICVNTKLGLIDSEIILQLRDKGNCGGPAGTGQSLRPAVFNVERATDALRLVIPDNVIPTVLDSVGFLVGEPVTITGFATAGSIPYRGFDGEYVISTASPGDGLAGVAAGSYLIEVPLPTGAPLPAVTLTGINLCLTEGRVTSQFNSVGDTGGLGPNVFGYIGGQLFPNAGGGAGTVAVFDEGILIDPAVSTFDFIGAGVTVTPAGAGMVDVTIPGGGGAPVGAEYVVMSLDATLTSERVLTAGTGIAIVDGGANAPVTLSVDATLAEILVNGNLTGGTDILVSTGDSILGVTDLVLDPGAGVGDNVIIDGLTWPSADGTPGQVLTTDGFGTLSFTTPSATGTTAILQWGNSSVANSTAARVLDPGYENRIAPLTTGTSFVDVRIPRAGTLRNLYVQHNNPGGTGAVLTYTVFVNGIATAITVGVASTTAQGADTVNSVVVAAGDRVRVVVTKVAVAGGGSRQPEVSLEVAA